MADSKMVVPQWGSWPTQSVGPQSPEDSHPKANEENDMRMMPEIQGKVYIPNWGYEKIPNSSPDVDMESEDEEYPSRLSNQTNLPDPLPNLGILEDESIQERMKSPTKLKVVAKRWTKAERKTMEQ